MSYTQSQMVYQYNWSARSDGDNPKVIAGTDWHELDRTQGYEMLYFINSLATTWGWPSSSPVSSYQHLERIIKNEVPSNVQTHGGIKGWIEIKYKGQSL